MHSVPSVSSHSWITTSGVGAQGDRRWRECPGSCNRDLAVVGRWRTELFCDTTHRLDLKVLGIDDFMNKDLCCEVRGFNKREAIHLHSSHS